MIVVVKPFCTQNSPSDAILKFKIGCISLEAAENYSLIFFLNIVLKKKVPPFI